MASSPRLVFVHIGPPAPKHLIENLRRTTRLFPEMGVVLIHSGQISSLPRRLAKTIELFTYTPETLKKFDLVPPQLNHDLGFWSGYYQSTFERFFAIGAYMCANPSQSIIHLESDVVLFPSFDPTLVHSTGESWPRINEGLDVASLFYSPSWKSYRLFLSQLKEVAQETPSLSDMTLLPRIRREGCYMNTQLASCSEDETVGNRGLFDGARLGTWLTGADPSNNWGLRVRYSNPGDHDLCLDHLEWKVDGNGGLLVRCARHSQPNLQWEPLQCLHVHSKQLEYFRPDNSKFLKRVARRANARSARVSFSVRPFLRFVSTHRRDLAVAIVSPAKWLGLMRRILFKNGQVSS